MIKEIHQGKMGEMCIHCGELITKDTPYADNDKFYNTLISLPSWKECYNKKALHFGGCGEKCSNCNEVILKTWHYTNILTFYNNLLELKTWIPCKDKRFN